MAMPKKSSAASRRGGIRPGAGRKPGYGPFGEKTQSVRIPLSQLAPITDFLTAYRERIEANRAAAKRAIGQMMLPLEEPPAQFISWWTVPSRPGTVMWSWLPLTAN